MAKQAVSKMRGELSCPANRKASPSVLSSCSAPSFPLCLVSTCEHKCIVPYMASTFRSTHPRFFHHSVQNHRQTNKISKACGQTSTLMHWHKPWLDKAPVLLMFRVLFCATLTWSCSHEVQGVQDSLWIIWALQIPRLNQPRKKAVDTITDKEG
jgi:hypothetical protein